MPRILFFILIILSLIWGGSFYFIKILLEDFGPWTIAFLRSSSGLITIVLIMLILRKPFELRKMPWFPLSFMALINTAIPWAFIAFSETRLSSNMASVLNATTPLWTIIIGIIFFRSATNRLQWVGLGIGLIGLIILLDVNPTSIISVDLLGFACMIAATICYGLGSQLSKRMLTGLSMYQITFCTLFIGSIGSGAVALSVESIAVSDILSWKNISVLIGLGGLGSGVAYVLFYYLVQKGSAEFATMVTYLVPATAIIWGYTLLGEEVKWTLLVGLFLVLGGVFLSTRQQTNKTIKDQSIKEHNVRDQFS
ncbi:DMT family transporter [Chengkuizengella axinellae]|uniref:DMT family transporter n=1 Tax=Chengkuizengella axinellae TaxID=3064388 RepID=A0ABT9J3C8_9BACL|nr:DMT family transporter [Chengkuizengella sp. 2205SS18-9]MDP5275983.1 DMT family transporter [Chengkuizengella sp. 2205SS18-9]